ncbi:LutB/LldF family L-lactate oxidation iron-sulfur protein [Lentzea nigeriaca]|uniref:LutB/LldF family L-lactate oxidation iron-sulfur protein n=1 Tax=Lentzea nigeriaca TaxID=1128665 RepID=UPI00195BC6C3|nr:LutB/LldF family L-lactate oxidation iron-sulfur protein [Lentzea nigeriaca]MBM7857645.1 L-lactate dehydrogenase complex protein LldF [Lentzea nigeriaca]
MARNPVTWLGSPTFPKAAKAALNDTQLRQNLRKATGTIRERRAAAVTEMTDWEQLRVAGEQIKDDVLARLDTLLVELEESVTARGGVVHWARDAEEANRIVLDLCRQENASEVVKVKSMATAEIGLNEALEAGGVQAIETDLAELIVQLGDDRPSHILVPAIHRNRSEIREIFQRRMGVELSDEPADLAEAARVYLREKFLTTKVAISGANFAVADTGSIVVLESEGNGRMCLTLPETLITVMGIEKLVPTWQDLEVFLQLLPRSSTAERMNPYTSVWTGVTPGDGPQSFHLVLIDNGRTATLHDSVGRQALRCIRCSACLNVCPVYERTGGQSYGSVYPGPIGAILTPQLVGDMHDPQAASLPYASSLCGACFEVCPVRIDIPSVLTHLRAEAVEAKGRTAESVAMAAAAWVFAEASRYEKAQKAGSLARFFAKDGRITSLPWPGSKWTSSRDVPAPPAESFRSWWRKNRCQK